MTELEAANALYQLVQQHFEPLHPNDPSDPLGIPWCGDNETFSPDNLGPLGCWMRLAWRPATDTQLTQGPISFNEAAGVFIVQVFGPLNEGVAKLTGICDDLRAALKRRRSGALRTLDAASSVPLSDGTWAMRIVTVEVRYTYTA